jgi:hypothetical protein
MMKCNIFHFSLLWRMVSGLSVNANISRRTAISLPFLVTTVNPQQCEAAKPLTSTDGDSFLAKIERKQRIPPLKLIRPTLNQDFAVLLMRSSYNALDELDCVPMDQFQKDFFFIRSAEYLNYVNQLGPGLVKQGELCKSFISFFFHKVSSN